MRYADFRCCPFVTDAGLIALTNGCRMLRIVNLEECEQISTAGLAALAQNCPMLEELDINSPHVTEHDVITIAEHCPLLVSLVSRACTDAALIALSKNCPLLRSLICHRSPCTTAGITALAKGCTKLYDLRFTYCSEITDAAIEAVIEHCPLMRFISLSGSWINLSRPFINRLLKIRQHSELRIVGFNS